MKAATKNIIASTAAVIALTAALPACSPEIPMVSLGLEQAYRVPRMQKLLLAPHFDNSEAYRWYVTAPGESSETIASTDREFIFLGHTEGTYVVRLAILDKDAPVDYSFTVDVMTEEIEYSPCISCVTEYVPAPGPFINRMPLFSDGDTYGNILRKAEKTISGDNPAGGMISLGACGGYVIVSFDHTVMNLDGDDFRILGSDIASYAVSVAYDTNMNGRPDSDEWYELADRRHDSPEAISGYTIAYRRPPFDHTPVPGNGTVTDAEYIRWTDSRGMSGYIVRDSRYPQEYYPLWNGEDELVFSGTLLPEAEDTHSGSTGSFDISSATDSRGNRVSLPGIDFVKIRKAVNAPYSPAAYGSPEGISGAEDLHISIQKPNI